MTKLLATGNFVKDDTEDVYEVWQKMINNYENYGSKKFFSKKNESYLCSFFFQFFIIEIYSDIYKRNKIN